MWHCRFATWLSRRRSVDSARVVGLRVGCGGGRLRLGIIGLALFGGSCNRGPTPPPPTDEQRAEMRRVEEAEAARRQMVQEQVERIRGGQPRPSTDESDSPAILPYDRWTLPETAADALGRIGRPAVAGLREKLRHPAADVRLRAARVLARIGPEAAEAVPELIGLLDDPDADVRRWAARALGQIGPAAEPAVPGLIELLDDA